MRESYGIFVPFVLSLALAWGFAYLYADMDKNGHYYVDHYTHTHMDTNQNTNSDADTYSHMVANHNVNHNANGDINPNAYDNADMDSHGNPDDYSDGIANVNPVPNCSETKNATDSRTSTYNGVI
jgi:hypothetical protein